MGCKTYEINDKLFSFSDDDSFACLCTFPHNNDYKLDNDDLRSLVLLGAAVTLSRSGDISSGFNWIPGDLPKWIIDEVDRLLPRDMNN